MKILEAISEAISFGGAIIYSLLFFLKNLAQIYHSKIKITEKDTTGYMAILLWAIWYYLSH